MWLSWEWMTFRSNLPSVAQVNITQHSWSCHGCFSGYYGKPVPMGEGNGYRRMMYIKYQLLFGVRVMS